MDVQWLRASVDFPLLLGQSRVLGGVGFSPSSSWAAMGAARHRLCMQAGRRSGRETRFQIIRYDFTNVHASLLSQKSLFSLSYRPRFLVAKRADVEASQSGFRGFMETAANRAFEWPDLWKRQHHGRSAMERLFRVARSVGVEFITALYDGAVSSRVLVVVSLSCAWANVRCFRGVRSSKPARSLFCGQTTTYIVNMGNDAMNHSH